MRKLKRKPAKYSNAKHSKAEKIIKLKKVGKAKNKHLDEKHLGLKPYKSTLKQKNALKAISKAYYVLYQSWTKDEKPHKGWDKAEEARKLLSEAIHLNGCIMHKGKLIKCDTNIH